MTDGARLGDEVALSITGMAHGGESVGRLADGRVVFASGGIPGESVTVRLTDVQSRFARGYVAAAPANPAPERTAAPCGYFGAWPGRGSEPHRHCGACQWQHITYEGQLAFKASILRDVLQRIAKMESPPVADVIGMPDPWRYRNHIRLRPGNGGLGYYGTDGTSVVPVETCPIAHPLVEELLGIAVGDLPAGAEVSLRAGTRTGDQMIVLQTAGRAIGEIEVETEVSVALVEPSGESSVVAGHPFLTEHLAGRDFIIPPDAFFQVNTEMAEHIVTLLRRAIGERVRRIVDVHSGVGAFAILLADLGEEVFAIERHGPSVAAAVENAAGLDHVTLVEGSAVEGLEYLDLPLSVVVVDPPRTGLDKDTTRLLVQRAPDTILYVSCEPSTLARDARELMAAGWSFTECSPVDMFPQTFHVESVNVFRR